MATDEPEQLGSRHFVVAIHGVGNPPSGTIKEAIRGTIEAAGDGLTAAVDIEEFNWNSFVPHAPMNEAGAFQYALWFSRSFITAAWQRGPSRRILESVRCVFDAIFHWILALGFTVVGFVLAGAILTALLARVLLAAGYLPEAWRVFGTVPAEWPVVVDRAAAALFGTAAWVTLQGGRMLGIVAVCSLVTAVVEAAWNRSPTPLWICLRRLVFLFLLAPSILLSLLFGEPASFSESFEESYTSSFTRFSLAVAIVLSLATGLLAGHFRRTLVLLAASLALVLLIYIAGSVIDRLRVTTGSVWLTGAKVMLDVALYVGSSEYRREIQSQLETLIAQRRDAANGGAIWLVGHSLGSVIALDCLVNSSVWRGDEKVYLVTLGSPIARLINRFFPAQLFPERAGSAAGAAACRVGSLHWLNIYRSKDYVGGSLGLGDAGHDVRSRQRWKAHANYWSDPSILDLLRERFSVVPAAPKDGNLWQSADSWNREPPSVMTAPVRTLASARWLIVTVSTALVAWLLFSLSQRQEDPWQPGIRSVAEVTHDRFVNVSRGELYSIHTFEFAIAPAEPGAPPIRASRGAYYQWGLTIDSEFDSDALANHIRAGCRPLEPRPDETAPCVRGGIRVEYDPKDPNRLLVLDFPAQRNLLQRAFLWVLIPVMVLGALIMTAMMSYVAVTAVLWPLAVFTGASPPFLWWMK